MEDKIIKLGEEEFKIIVNFKNCYKLTKFRNKIESNIDFSNADEKIIEEFNSIDLNEDGTFPIEKLSLKARKFVLDNTRDSRDVFSLEEIFEIVKVLTNIEDEEKINSLLDKEIEINGFDILIDKLINGISMVFTNAKDGLQQKGLSK